MTPIDDSNISNPPYRYVLSLECKFENFDPRVGSAFLIAPNFALTAAHVMYHQGERAYDIICRTQRCGSLKADTIRVEKYAYHHYYEVIDKKCTKASKMLLALESVIKDSYLLEKVKYDYALLMLEKPIDTSYLPLSRPSSLKFYGYPGSGYDRVETDRRHGTAAYLYESFADISDILVFNKICFGGMSGGPVLSNNYSLEHSVTPPLQISAIVSHSSELDCKEHMTLGCAITHEKQKQIEEWMEKIEFLQKNEEHNNTSYVVTEKRLSTEMSIMGSHLSGSMASASGYINEYIEDVKKYWK
jgi:hypothetical protein